MFFGLTRPGIEPEFIVSVADALCTRPLTDSNKKLNPTEAFSLGIGNINCQYCRFQFLMDTVLLTIHWWLFVIVFKMLSLKTVKKYNVLVLGGLSRGA